MAGITKLITKLKNMNVDTIVAFCDCISDDHYLTVTRDVEEETGKPKHSVYYFAINPGSHESFFGRIGYALRYIFNGPYTDQIVLYKKEVKELINSLMEVVAKDEKET